MQTGPREDWELSALIWRGPAGLYDHTQVSYLGSKPQINQGGVILIDYLPGIGTRITINGVARATIPGEDFNRAMLRIWLGDRPVDGRLKRMLLGGEDSVLPF